MNTAIIRLTLVLLLGICSGFYLELALKSSFLALLFGTGLFIFAFLRAKKLLFPDLFFGSSTFILLFLLGIFTTSLHLPQNQPKHYLNRISPKETPELFRLSLKENLKPDLFNEKFIAQVQSVNQKISHGKVLLLLPKDNLEKLFLEGEEMLVFATPEAIPSPINPYQFDYSEFMSRKGIFRQLSLREAVFTKIPEANSGIKAGAAKLRKQITTALQEHSFGKDELAIVQALLLGQKQDISAETYNNFAAAGAIHILAVSGLHVGIILLILNSIFSPLKRINNGRYLKTFLVIICLWGFAVLAGLSPSVVRAVTMFSFIAVGLEIKRRTGTLNSVFLSLMLLLLIKPQWIFEVGFQLSYSAVLAIVLFQPLLAELLQPSTKLGKYIWGLLTVTIAAQVGVLPLSLYYFHQFPGLFFLSNLLILPFLGFILILGVLVIFLALAGALPGFLAKAYEIVIQTLNKTVALVAEQEQFLLKDIPFSLAELWAWYLLIFTVFLFLKYSGYRKLLGILASVVILQVVYIYQEVKPRDQLIVFHRSRNTILGDVNNNRIQVYHNLDLPVKNISLIKNHVVGERITSIEEEPLKNIYSQKGHFLILLDSTGILPQEIPKGVNLLLSGSPRVNLDRILQGIQPSLIIADGSNYRSVVGIWKETASKMNIPFHYTADEGAFIME